jgi:hypothetical protein
MYTRYGVHTLVVTFSALLKVAGRALCREKPHVTVESYHSSVQSIFCVRCGNSHDLDCFLSQCHSISPQVTLTNIGLFVVDEVQDVNSTTCALINWYRPMFHPQHSLLIVGDEDQAVFQKLQGSSVDYLLSPEKHFFGSFCRMTMSLSFRVPSVIAEWINQCLPRSIPIRSARHGGRVIHESFPFYSSGVPPHVLSVIKDSINIHGPESVVVLSKSVRVGDSHPLSQIMRACDTRWIVLNGDFQEDDALLIGKSIAATPWKFKGRQAPLVVVVGLDESLERPTNDLRLAFCLANVMCTRASDTLIVLSNSKERSFFTLRTNDVSTSFKARAKRATPISELYKYVPYNARLDTMPSEVIKRVPNAAEMNVPAMVQVKGLWEPSAKVFHDALARSVRDALTETKQPWAHYLTMCVEKARVLLPVEAWLTDEHCVLLDTLLERILELLPDGDSFTYLRDYTRDGLTAKVFLVFDDCKCITLATKQGSELLQEAVLAGHVARAREAIVIYPCVGESVRTWQPYEAWLEDMRARIKT